MTQTMIHNKSLNDWLTYMQGIHVSAIDLGLSRVLPVAEKLGVMNSAKKAYVFTVAGTNGKGSTTAVIAEICQRAGYKTALYQSPELIEFNERIRINGEPVSDELLINAFEQVEQARIDCGLSLSFFEMTTLAGFLIFAQSDCDVWVLEVGLGGRLDVVNIIDPNVAVITNIGIDHIDWLGDDREKIGFEKSGILRQKIPLIYGEIDMPSSVQENIDKFDVECYQLGTDFYYAHDELSTHWQYSNAATTLQLDLPKLSLLNVTNAISAVMASDLSINQQQINQAMQHVVLAGRYDYRRVANRQWLFDVAHNEQGVQFFLQQLEEKLTSYLSSDGRLVLLFSMLKDKDIDKVVNLLTSSTLPITHWHSAPIDHIRAASVSELQQVLAHYIANDSVSYYADISIATNEVIKQTNEQDLIVVCGSFHTIAESLRSLVTLHN